MILVFCVAYMGVASRRTQMRTVTKIFFDSPGIMHTLYNTVVPLRFILCAVDESCLIGEIGSVEYTLFLTGLG